MGRAPCCDKANVKKGPWSPEEDAKLKEYIEKHGTGGNWIALPQKVGLRRCGKSCRLRWLNYLRPNIKHGEFSDEEDRVIINLFANIGSRWSIIAAQLPGRTDNDIKNYWNTKLKKKLMGIINNQSTSHNLRKPLNNTASTNLSSSYHNLQPSQPFNSPYDPQHLINNVSSAFASMNNLQVPRESFLSQMQHYNHSFMMFGHHGDQVQASCSSSDGREFEQAIGATTNLHGSSGVVVEEKVNNMVSNVNAWGSSSSSSSATDQQDHHHQERESNDSLLYCDLEEIKQLISSTNVTTNNSSSSCSNKFLFDENKTDQERVLYYYYY